MARKKTTNQSRAKTKPRLDKFEVQMAADTLMAAGQMNSRLKSTAKVELGKRKAAIAKVIKKKDV